MDNAINTNSYTTTPNYSQYCANRLPCGLCRLTNAICPLTCTATTVTSVWTEPFTKVPYTTTSAKSEGNNDS